MFKKVKCSLSSPRACCADTLTVFTNKSLPWIWSRHVRMILLLDCWGYPNFIQWQILFITARCCGGASNLTQGHTKKAMLFWSTLHIQLQIILSTVLLCHIDSIRTTTGFSKAHTYMANHKSWPQKQDFASLFNIDSHTASFIQQN